MLKDRKRLSRSFDDEEDVPNPLDSLSNLSDVMLVFACGLMVALIINLKVDVSRLDQAVVKYRNDTTKTTVEKSGGKGMEKMGTVYKDPKTGKTYILEQDKSKSGGNSKDKSSQQ